MDPHKETPASDAEREANAARERERVGQVKSGTGGRLFLVAFVVVIALGVAFAFVRFRKKEAESQLASATHATASEPPTVNVITVHRADSVQTLSLPAETASWDESTIYSRVSGYVSKWNVDIGDHVKAGQSLAFIDTPDLDAEFAAARAKLNAAVAEVGVRDAEVEFAKTTDERWKNSPKGVVSDQEREAKSASYAESVAQLAAAKAQVALQQAEVDRLSALTEFKDVKAPFEGVIVQRRIDIGDLVTAGSSNGTSSLYRLSRDYPMRVFTHAPQSVAAQLIDGGAEAEVTLPDDPGVRIVSHVARTARAVDPASRTMRVEVDIQNPVHGLAPGMYAQVKFKLAGVAGFQVPAAAMMFRTIGPQVAVVDNSGAVSFKDVTIGTDDGSVVSIVSGLENGDKVALNLSSQIVAGAKVKPREAPEAVAANGPAPATSTK